MTNNAGMSDPLYQQSVAAPTRSTDNANLADILERVLDKGIVIAGDIRIDLLNVELLTIRLRLIVASVERAEAMGIDWWRNDSHLTGRSSQTGQTGHARPSDQTHATDRLAEENRALRERIARLEQAAQPPDTRGAPLDPRMAPDD